MGRLIDATFLSPLKKSVGVCSRMLLLMRFESRLLFMLVM